MSLYKYVFRLNIRLHNAIFLSSCNLFSKPHLEFTKGLEFNRIITILYKVNLYIDYKLLFLSLLFIHNLF